MNKLINFPVIVLLYTLDNYFNFFLLSNVSSNTIFWYIIYNRYKIFVLDFHILSTPNIFFLVLALKTWWININIWRFQKFLICNCYNFYHSILINLKSNLLIEIKKKNWNFFNKFHLTIFLIKITLEILNFSLKLCLIKIVFENWW